MDGAALARAMSHAAVADNAKLMRGRAELARDARRVTGVAVDGETVDADTVVVTAGVWANEILAPLGLRIAVEPERGQIIHLRLPGVNPGNWPVLLPLNDYYLLAFDDFPGRCRRNAGNGFREGLSRHRGRPGWKS